MSFLSGLSGTPHLGDKGVENHVLSSWRNAQLPGLCSSTRDTKFERLTLSTLDPEAEIASRLHKEVFIHKLGLVITTNIYK